MKNKTFIQSLSFHVFRFESVACQQLWFLSALSGQWQWLDAVRKATDSDRDAIDVLSQHSL